MLTHPFRHICQSFDSELKRVSRFTSMSENDMTGRQSRDRTDRQRNEIKDRWPSSMSMVATAGRDARHASRTSARPTERTRLRSSVTSTTGRNSKQRRHGRCPAAVDYVYVAHVQRSARQFVVIHVLRRSRGLNRYLTKVDLVDFRSVVAVDRTGSGSITGGSYSCASSGLPTGTSYCVSMIGRSICGV